MRLLTLFLLIVITSPGVVRAEPGPVVNWLINEPASLFDIGMMKLRDDIIQLEEEVDDQFANDVITFSSIDNWYDWDKNRLYIEYTALLKSNLDDDFIKSFCKSTLDRFRVNAALTKRDKHWSYFISGKGSYYAQKFGHEGYVKKNEPKDLHNKLDKIIELRAALRTPTKQIICSSPLLEAGFSVKTEDIR